MSPAIFFDRDGVLSLSFVINNKAYAPRTFSEFKIVPKAREIIKKLKDLDFLIFVVTNQPDLSKGLIKFEELEKMHQLLTQELVIDEIFYCPHTSEHQCQCRKPKPGMLIQASEKWPIDLKNSFMIGDQHTDIKAGKDAGCTTVLIKKSYSGECQPDYTIDNLSEIVDIVKHNGNS